jgi:hypothetical protein
MDHNHNAIIRQAYMRKNVYCLCTDFRFSGFDFTVFSGGQMMQNFYVEFRSVIIFCDLCL